MATVRNSQTCSAQFSAREGTAPAQLIRSSHASIVVHGWPKFFSGLKMLLASLAATASPPCTLNVPAHNVHYDLRGVPGVSGIYQGSSDRSVNEGLAEAHKAPPKAAPAAARVHRPPKLKALVADAPSPASASKPPRRAGREGRGMMAVLILGAVAVGVGVWRVALSKSHW